MKDNQMRKYNKTKLNPRHSRFMGTYVVQNMKSINDENKLIVHKAARNMDDLLDDSNKKAIRKAKNKMVFEVGLKKNNFFFITCKFITTITLKKYFFDSIIQER